DLADAAEKIARSKIFDNATSCSSENSVIAVASVADALLEELARNGGVLLEAREAEALQSAMFVDGHPGLNFVAQSAAAIALRAGLSRQALLDATFLIVAEAGVGPAPPFSAH